MAEKRPPMETFELDSGRASEFVPIMVNPMRGDGKATAPPAYQIVEAEEYNPNANSNASSRAEAREAANRADMAAKIEALKEENLVLMNNNNLRQGGDKNMPMRADETHRDSDVAEAARELSAVKKANANIPTGVRSLNPRFDIEGPNPLDNVDYETTNYAIPKRCVSHMTCPACSV
jgi:hypothetical protein